MSRPKNEDIGKPLQNKRVPVMVTDEEHAELTAAAERLGIGVSTYMRTMALQRARGNG